MQLPDSIDPARVAGWTGLALSRLPALFDTGPDWALHGDAFAAGLALALAPDVDPAAVSPAASDHLLISAVLRAAHAGFDVHRFVVPVPHLRRARSVVCGRGDWIVDLARLWRGEPVTFELRQHRLLLQLADRMAEAWNRQPSHPDRILLRGLAGFSRGRGTAAGRARTRRLLCDTFRARMVERLGDDGSPAPLVCAADLVR